MTKLSVVVVVIAILLLTSAAVYGGPLAGAKAEAGDPARGRVIFEQPSIHGTRNCSTCHSLELGLTLVGPSLVGVGSRAVTLLSSPAYKGRATTPEELLREAILTRDCKLWGGSRHLVIPEWEGVFDRQELIDLTAFLATLK